MLSNLVAGSLTVNHPPRRPPRDPRAMRDAAEAGKGYIVGEVGNMRLIRKPRVPGHVRGE